MIGTSATDALEFFDELKSDDAAYARYAERMQPLAEFMAEYEYRKDSAGYTQAEIASRMHTRQSSISRFEAMKHPPSYDFLQNLSKALGDRLFVSPSASYSMTLPYDLREAADAAAGRRGLDVPELMAELLREELNRDQFMVRGSGTLVGHVGAICASAVQVLDGEAARDKASKRCPVDSLGLAG